MWNTYNTNRVWKTLAAASEAEGANTFESLRLLFPGGAAETAGRDKGAPAQYGK